MQIFACKLILYVCNLQIYITLNHIFVQNTQFLYRALFFFFFLKMQITHSCDCNIII